MSLWFGRRRGERILEKQLRNGVFGLALAGLLAFSPYFSIAQTSGKSEGSARAAVRRVPDRAGHDLRYAKAGDERGNENPEDVGFDESLRRINDDRRGAFDHVGKLT